MECQTCGAQINEDGTFTWSSGTTVSKVTQASKVCVFAKDKECPNRNVPPDYNQTWSSYRGLDKKSKNFLAYLPEISEETIRLLDRPYYDRDS